MEGVFLFFVGCDGVFSVERMADADGCFYYYCNSGIP